ncbi:MAG: glycosyl hydrolase family 28-related protein, partial [Planctomycetia bacterium]
SKGEAVYSNDVPAPFVYDPLACRTRPNRSSVHLKWNSNETTYFSAPFDPSGGLKSFTLECFVKLDPDQPENVNAAAKTRRSDEAYEFVVGARRLYNFNQTYYGGFFKPPKQPAVSWTTGSYVTIGHFTAESRGWRHQALVYDAEKKTVSLHLDHWLSASRPAPVDLKWDDGPWCFGGGDWRAPLLGMIDELRISRRALTPAEFLRPVQTELKDVSFASRETVLPRASGYINLKEGFGAFGDGVHDDTSAFKKAFAELPNKVPLDFFTLYIPPGVYLLSDCVQCSRFFAVQGAGKGETILRLAPKSPNFQDAKNPIPVVRASSSLGPLRRDGGVTGSSIGLYIADLTIDVGADNPGAKGIEYHSNNHGSLTEVAIRAGEHSGAVGLDLTHKTNGPALIKNVSIDGFDVGVACMFAEYSLTFEHLTLRNQRTVGVRNDGNILAIRDLRSSNRGPAIVSPGAGGMVTLIDADLSGGAGENAAIVAEGALYARNVTVAGYGDSIR